MSALALSMSIAVATSTAGCGPRKAVVHGVEVPYEDGANLIYIEGKQASEAGDPATAKIRFKEIVDNFDESSRAPDALADLAAILLEEGGCIAARIPLEYLAERHPLHARAAQAKATLRQCDGTAVVAQGPLESLKTKFLQASTDGERRDLASKAAEAAVLGGDFGAGVRWYRKVLEVDAQERDRQATRAKIADLIDSRVSFREVRELLEEQSGIEFPKEILTYKLARIQYHIRDLGNAEATLRTYLATWPNDVHAAGARNLLEVIAARANVKPLTVGVLLPLSGQYRAYGENALEAIQLALESEAPADKSGQAIQIKVRDTKSERAEAAKAFQELALDEGAIAVIGAMFTSEAEPAAYKAQELGVPLITIAAADHIADIGPYVFRNGLTNRAQAKALVDYAMDVLGMKRFAILYPRHPYGEELLHLFWDEVERRRGEIRGIESYGTEDTTFQIQVKRLVARDVLNRRSDYHKSAEECDKQPDAYRKSRCREKAVQDLRPIVDFDGLFIPDYPRSVSMVAAALAFEDIIVEQDPRYLQKIEKTLGRKVTPVTLLGASGWNSPKLIETAGRNVENAIFTDAFFADAEDKVTAEFVAAFKKKYKRMPVLPEALAFDAMSIVRYEIRTAKPTTRDAMRENLRRLHGFPGVSGMTSFVAGTDAQKPVRILTIKNGVIRDVPPVAESLLRNVGGG